MAWETVPLTMTLAEFVDEARRVAGRGIKIRLPSGASINALHGVVEEFPDRCQWRVASEDEALTESTVGELVRELGTRGIRVEPPTVGDRTCYVHEIGCLPYEVRSF